MLKFNRFVCAMVICGFAAAAHGQGAVKIRSLTPTGPNGLAENPDGDGFAILNFHEGNNLTEIQVAITNFLPHTLYSVQLDSNFGSCGALDALETNTRGNGTLHFTCGFDKTGEAVVTIYIFDGNFDQNLTVTDDEIRAQGSAE